MGLTIYFKGSITSLSKIDPLTDVIKSIADELEWKYEIFNEEFTQPIALKGITLHPHPKSEWLNILFDNHGQLNDCVGIQFEQHDNKSNSGRWNFIKTQFAPIHIHIAVVKILQFIQSKYIPNLEVVDEGGYWETGDLEGLDERRESLNRAMDILEDKLKSVKVHSNTAKTSEIIDIIEKIIREDVAPKMKRKK